ncbi:hypothetical protein L2E82_29094 [Cichorium intybus]|uniref:Uncharacterized protein n=1 Tax=Cichorium intybus TaxID=13427 RepID=A0ACB9CX92_CICIN|nr:hypothetical protein L2E82_29094 [Cichorium intybus]
MELKQELGTIVGRGDFQAIKAKTACYSAQIATDQETAQAQGAVWDKMVVVHAKARNNRELNAASIQIETASRDENDKCKDICKRQYQISRESEKDKNGAPYGYDSGLLNPNWCGLRAMIYTLKMLWYGLYSHDKRCDLYSPET